MHACMRSNHTLPKVWLDMICHMLPPLYRTGMVSHAQVKLRHVQTAVYRACSERSSTT